MIEIIRDIKTWQELKRSKLKNQSIGFVPTMGALHAAHLSLVQAAMQDNDVALVSIFVNPTQFNDANDLKNYPRPIEQDIALLNSIGCQYLLLPDYEELYKDQYRFKVSENDFSTKLCGAHRPGHFDGVLSVVMKLLNIADADKAYFGKKDFQQLQLIKDMSEAFFMKTEILAMPTLREADGLAMSSRNLRLNPEERKQAPKLYQIIKTASSAQEAKDLLSKNHFVVDYVEDVGNTRLAAVHLGSVRLIDNVQI